MKRYRWNRKVFLNNLLELAVMSALTGLFVWLTCEWIMKA